MALDVIVQKRIQILLEMKLDKRLIELTNCSIGDPNIKNQYIKLDKCIDDTIKAEFKYLLSLE